MDLAELGLDDKKHFELDNDTSLMTQVIRERNIYYIRHYSRKIKHYSLLLLLHRNIHELCRLKQHKLSHSFHSQDSGHLLAGSSAQGLTRLKSEYLLGFF